MTNQLIFPRPNLLPDTSRGMHATILVVDDQPGICVLISACLEHAGYLTLSCNSGADALQLIRSQPRIQLLVSDIQMPEMSGLELAQQTLKLRPHLPVLLMSGATPDANKLQQAQNNGCLFLAKPCPPQTLLNTAQALLSRTN